MSFRYTRLGRTARRLYRAFRPVPRSPWTSGQVEDMCAINLVPPEDLIAFFKGCIEQLQDLRGPDIGDYLEFGVFNGSSMGSMYRASDSTYLHNFRMFGFDSFDGLPPGSEHGDSGVFNAGDYRCSFEDMTRCLVRQKIDFRDITWIKGWYTDTLTPHLRVLHQLKLGIVFVDCDAYESAKAVLGFIRPLIKEPFIICFDDWKLNDLDLSGDGEYAAFNEFLEQNPRIEAVSIPSYNRKSRSFLVRLR